MSATERRPSQAGYWIGGLIALAGLVAGAALLVGTFAGGVRDLGEFSRLPRVSVPGQAEIPLRAGKHVVYLESTQGEPAPGAASVRVQDASSGRSVALQPYATTFTYTAGGRSGRAVHTLVAPRSSRYRVTTSGAGGTGLDVAIGPPLGGKLAGTVSRAFSGFGLLVGGPILGGALMLITGTRRHRFDRRAGRPPGAGQPQAGAGQPGPPARPQPGWYPDPSDQRAWRWWDGQRWTDHTG